jgi:hypothetical protein
MKCEKLSTTTIYNVGTMLSQDPAKHRVLDVRVVSDRKTLYLFSMRNKGAHYTTNLAAFDAAMESVRFTSVMAK